MPSAVLLCDSVQKLRFRFWHSDMRAVPQIVTSSSEDVFTFSQTNKKQMFWWRDPKVLNWTFKMTQYLRPYQTFNQFIFRVVIFVSPLPLVGWWTKDNPSSFKPSSGTGWLLCNSYYSSSVTIEADRMRQWLRWQCTTGSFNRPLETTDEVRKGCVLPQMIGYPTMAAINGCCNGCHTFHSVSRVKIFVLFVWP